MSSSPEWISFQRPLSFDRVTNGGDESTVSGAASMANDYVNQSPSDSFPHNYINKVHNATNANSAGCSISIKNIAELPVRERQDVFDDDDEAEVFTSPSLLPATNGGHFRCAYVNLPSPLDGVSGDSELGSRGCQYVNIGSSVGGFDQTGTQLMQPTDRCAGVTYAQLDLFGEGTNGRRKCRSSAGSGPAVDVESSKTKPDAYASIDFQRTRALSSKVEDELDEGHRKTRHNSTIDKWANA